MHSLARFATALALATLSLHAHAQAWPSKPIRYVVPFAAGGSTDIMGRTIAEKLSVALGQPVVVENKPGAGGGLGAAEVAKAAPDGYTIMGGTISTHAINASLYKDLPYDPVKDFVAVTLIARVPNMLVVNNDVKAKDVAELIKLMKANPGKWNFASAGNGTSQHLSGELFKGMAGVEMQHIPYKGSPPALTDVMGGSVSMTFDNITTAWPLAKAGKLRALAVTTAKRSPVAPGGPDARGVRTSRLRGRVVAGRVRAGGRASGDRCAAQHGDREDHQHARRAEEDHRARRRACRRHGGAVRRIRQDRSREVGRRREEVRREGRLMARLIAWTIAAALSFFRSPGDSRIPPNPSSSLRPARPATHRT